METTESLLQFVQFSSTVNPSFWHKFAQLKVDVFKLEENAGKIWGYYSNLNCNSTPSFEVDSTSFNSEYNGLKYYLPYHGILISKNTIEQFKDCDKQQIIKSIGNTLEDHIKLGHVLSNPSLLNYFLILCFADLKKYNFYYWFVFPAFHSIKSDLVKQYPINEVFDESQLNVLCSQYEDLSINDQPFFLISHKKSLNILTLSTRISIDEASTNMEDYEDIFFAFSDSTKHSFPGWPLRNYILLLLYYCPNLHGKTLKFVSFRLNRKGSGSTQCNNSTIWEVTIPKIDKANIFTNGENRWFGYEPNERGKMGPRLVKMKESMSPSSLAESSVDLNLKLMKWRILPDINLDKIKNTKCLLLGAGTLGCAVARNLMAWGVRTITFVDNGVVSYSNPVRQNLYIFDDCIAEKPKALAAAESLLKIFPGIISAGHSFTIPMPGHTVGSNTLDQTKESYEKLEKLIADHDVIFLLMDSREGRWLPTLMCTSLKKITINAALGFDTYLIMRHGLRTETPENTCSTSQFRCIPGNDLGCYFCNDITAPGDSLKDRTLDQQCTVSRPGVANIAGALAVELAISLIQHKKGGSTPAFFKLGSRQDDDISYNAECDLGIVPHSIRGFLSTFNNVLPATERYNQCIACSDIVVDFYKESGFLFVLQVLNDPSYLEKITGLSNMHMNCGELEELHTSEEESN